MPPDISPGYSLIAVLQADLVQQLGGLLQMLLAELPPLPELKERNGQTGLVEHQAEGHVLLGGEEIVERIVLVHDAHVAAGPVDQLAVDANLALLGRMGAQDGPQQGRLPAAAGPDHRHDLPGGDLQVDVVQDPVRPEPVADVCTSSAFTAVSYSPNQGQSFRRRDDKAQSISSRVAPRMIRYG